MQVSLPRKGAFDRDQSPRAGVGYGDGMKTDRGENAERGPLD
jgi:hypothetical protein